MFSGVWQENTNRVMIDAYSYDVYYSYLQTNDITIIEVGVTNKRIIPTTEVTKERKYEFLAGELKLMYPGANVTLIPLVLTW